MQFIKLIQTTLLLACLTLLLGCESTSSNSTETDNTVEDQTTQATLPKPESLFDGQSLEGWESTSYGGEGEITVEDGSLVIGVDNMLSGVTTTREDYPTMDYEIELEAKKVNGIDFFCGLTFPVNDTHCSLIVGGWAGTVVGFSCIDGDDASENETSISQKFEKDQWYKIKLRVQPTKLTA